MKLSYVTWHRSPYLQICAPTRKPAVAGCMLANTLENSTGTPSSGRLWPTPLGLLQQLDGQKDYRDSNTTMPSQTVNGVARKQTDVVMRQCTLQIAYRVQPRGDAVVHMPAGSARRRRGAHLPHERRVVHEDRLPTAAPVRWRRRERCRPHSSGPARQIMGPFNRADSPEL